MLGLVVPPMVLWAYGARPAPPTMTPVPAALGIHTVGEMGAPMALARLAARAWITAGQGQRWLTLEARPPLAIPDPLVYWIPGVVEPDALPERLPETARLLGAWDGRAGRFPLPATAGAIGLYALGHQRVLDVLAVPASGVSREAS